jgi:hypothetical protein
MATKQPTAYPLRMPDDLREKVEAASSESGRSVNQEIAARLADSFESGKSLPKTVIEVVQKAAEVGRTTFDDALLRYIVAGMQAEPMRRASEEALQAERYKGIAAHHLLRRTAETLNHMAESITSLEFTPEQRGEWQQKFMMLTHEINRFDRM